MRARTTEASAAGSQATERAVKLGYRPGLDGLRAVAVFGVIGYHYYHWPTGGANGVELFFVLSGFLITSLLMEEWRERRRISLSRFYLRRALRLLPALWFMLLGWTVIALVTGHFVPSPLVYGLTYTTNIAAAFEGGLPGLGHLWSLGNEEQFYFLWPLLLIVMLRWRWRPLRLVAVAATLAFVEVVVRDAFDQRPLIYFRFDAMLIGCVAGILFASPLNGKLRSFCCAPPVAATGATLLAYLLLRPPQWTVLAAGYHISPYSLVFALAAAVTIVWVVEGCPGFRPAYWGLASPPVAYLGRISYAIYLWHIVVLDFLRVANGGYVWTEQWIAPLAIVCTIGVASVSYFLVERRFLRMKWRLSTTGSHDADATVVLGRHGPELTLQPETP